MVTPDQDHLIPRKQIQDEFLQLQSFGATIIKIAADHQFVWFGILKESLFRQCGFQFGEISVDIGGDIVFRRNYSVIPFNIVSSSGMSCMTVS